MKKVYIYLFFTLLLVGGFNANAHNFFCHSGKRHFVANNTHYDDRGYYHLAYNDSKSNSPYLDNNGDVVSIKSLKNMKDDEYITLQGYIIKKIKKEKYLFKDSTGEIVLDIDSKINKQLKNIDEKTLVEVYGEFDKEILEKNEINVKKITIVK